MGFDEGWEYDAGYGAEFDSEFDLGYGAEDLYLSLIPDEERQRYWSESVWSDPIDEEFRPDSLLFAHRGAEAELLPGDPSLRALGCVPRPALHDGRIPRAVGADLRSGRYSRLAAARHCAMLGRPNASANWELAATSLCRGHLRFRLGHAEIDGGGRHRAW